ncbi:hypothetical protein AT258_21045 [Bacillus wiedmannii]|uniref:hypothetical protein n=1 Tax=Bacillus TaxID=1386 RepID=UPI00077AD329|nr:hypothetical protein [Bacillus mobilis]KXY79062.1 hypothetical protein AT258_21045 [Bacillus wiedmannii]
MTTKENYLLNPNFDQNKFYQMRKTMFKEDRIMKDKRGKHNAVLLYGGIEDKINLSKKTHLEKGDSSFMTLDGEYYCVYPVKTAKEEFDIKQGKYGQHKALLRDAGLIHYEPQEEQKEGYASKITYTPWDIWVQQNGLYSDGEWVIPPSIDDYYNPTDIVTVQPTITPISYDEVQQPIGELDKPITEEDIAEYDELMKQAHALAVQFYKAQRMPEVTSIVEKYLGEGNKLNETIVKDLPLVRQIYADMENQFASEVINNL